MIIVKGEEAEIKNILKMFLYTRNENIHFHVGACDGEPCFKGVRCTNIGYGNFKCEACPKGYRGDGKTCTDIDEVVALLLFKEFLWSLYSYFLSFSFLYVRFSC